MKILVVGAGVAGLTFIRSLQKLHATFGYFKQCTIVVAERSSLFSEGVGIVLHSNGLRVLDILDLSGQLRPSYHPINMLKVSGTDEEFSVDLREAMECDGYLTQSVLRKDLHSVLANCMEQEAGIPVEIRMGLALDGINTSGDQLIASFINGLPEAFDLVVGADGVHSRVRKIWFPDSHPVSTGLYYFRFLARDQNERSEWQTFQHNDCSFGFIPLANGLVHCFVQLPLPAAPILSNGEASYLMDLSLPNHRFYTALNGLCSTIQHGFAYMVPPGNWYRDRVVLLGDAAHAVSPTLSQGGSLAMEDAVALAISLTGQDQLMSLALYRSVREGKCIRAHRMAVAQLNTLHKRGENQPGRPAIPKKNVSAILMKGMYQPLLENDLPPDFKKIIEQMTEDTTPHLITN